MESIGNMNAIKKEEYEFYKKYHKQITRHCVMKMMGIPEETRRVYKNTWIDTADPEAFHSEEEVDDMISLRRAYVDDTLRARVGRLPGDKR